MANILYVTGVSYVIGVAGFLSGASIIAVAHGAVTRMNGAIKGFTAGLLIAFVCFSMLPLAFLENGVVPSVAGILLGIGAAALMEGGALKGSARGGMSGGVVLCVGIALHKLPEGIALGSLLETNTGAGFTMAAVMAAHCLPEAAFLFMALKEEGVGYVKQLALCFALCLPMALGALIGGVFASMSSLLVSFCLTFAGGIIIYVTCGEIVPDKSGRLELGLRVSGAAAGFALGSFIMAHM